MNWGFNYINEKLYSNAVKVINLAKGFVGLSHTGEIFYSIKPGNWNDVTIWETVSRRIGKLPTAADDVYIKHTVAMNVNVTVASLFVSNAAVLTVNAGITLQINTKLSIASASLINKGTVNFNYPFDKSTVAGGMFDFTTYANTIGYLYNGDCTLPAYSSYKSLYITGKGLKNFSCNTSIATNLTVEYGGGVNLGIYDLSVDGTTSITSANLFKTGAGNILFTGQLSVTNFASINLSGNPEVELRGGITGDTSYVTSGSGNWKFTTNNQTFNHQYKQWTIQNILIDNIVLTLLGNNSNYPAYYVQVSGSINGTTVTSELRIGNSAALLIATPTQPMTTGIFTPNYGTSFAWVSYNYNGNYTIPAYTYVCLNIEGTGIKTASNSLSVQYLRLLGQIELGSWDLTVSTNLTANHKLSKSGTGTITFEGTANIGSNPSAELYTYGSGCTVIFKNGITGDGKLTTGGSTVKFNTNNQAVNMPQSGFNQSVIGDIVIEGAITVTFTSFGAQPIMNGILNGNNANSILIHLLAGTKGLRYRSATAPMLTGKLYCNQDSTNTFYYDASFNQDIKVPDDPTTPGYRNLTLEGSEAKKLLGNVSVKGTYTLTAPATLDSNGYSLTNP